MSLPITVSTGLRDYALNQLAVPLALDELAPPPEGAAGGWEVEIGFGKGRYLLRRAQEDPGTRFLGIEIVTKYQKMLTRRARRRGLVNLVTLRAEAAYLLSAVLPRGFAAAVHVYFPDPWPKTRHHKRRLFDAESVDLVLGLLRPGGKLYFATDFLSYGQRVREILESHPALEVHRHEEPWPDGARTNYEAKYLAQGRPVIRLTTVLGKADALFHPRGAAGILAGTSSGTSLHPDD